MKSGITFQELARLGMEQLAKQRPITMEIALAQAQRIKDRRSDKSIKNKYRKNFS